MTLFLLALMFLQGCSTCYTANLVNVRPVALVRDFELQDTQSYTTRLLAADVADLRLGLCEPVSELYVCLEMRIAPGRTAVFAEQSFKLVREGQSPQMVAFPQQQYRIHCQSTGGKPFDCPTPPEITVYPDAPKVMDYSASHNDWRLERWIYTVPPLTAFQGQAGDPDPPAWKLFSKYSRWHEFRLQLAPATDFDEKETLLELPVLEISGKRYVVPPLRVQRLPTKMCPVNA